MGVALDPGQVLVRRIAEWAGRDPARPFLVEVTGRSAGYGEVWELARRWAGWLALRGVRPGDRVVSLLPPSIDAVCLWLGTACLGALEVPVDPGLRGAFLTHALRLPQARLCVVPATSAELVRVPGLEVVVLDPDPAEVRQAAPLPVDGSSLPSPADPACVIYTSGTTGPAKGVVLSWAQLAATVGRIPRSRLGGDDAVYCCHPMFHVTGRSPLLSMADVGGRVVLRERFSASRFLDDVRAHGATSTTAQVPLLLATPEAPDDADNPLRIVLASCGAALARRFERRFGVRVIECYGSTEAGFPLLTRTAPADERRRWMGRPRRGYDARVVDAEGRPVPDGQVGELWVRPAARELMMIGYLDDPEATDRAFRDGWYRTGDAVLRDPGGDFAFVDRMRDTIRRNGENISSVALEATVEGDREVAGCAVLGVPDRVTGQEVLLAVVPTDPDRFDPAALHARLGELVPRHMLPSVVVVVDKLPRTPTNKVRKVGLLDRLDLTTAWRPPTR